MTATRTIIVSNRLPNTVTFRGGKWEFSRSAGGLVTALNGLKPAMDFHWVGWPGREIGSRDQGVLTRTLRERFHSSPVYLSREEIKLSYNGFCNQVVWPLFHYLPGAMKFMENYWTAYVRMNRHYAEAIARIAKANDLVWIHDYHLMLVPQYLREIRRDLTIGFFLHIPFPSSEVYRLLAVRHEILRGILGADLVGFHTYDYLRHFHSACLRLLGLESIRNVIELKNRRVRLGVYPIEIQPEHFLNTLKTTKCERFQNQIKKTFSGRRILLGVDRMDYTKGLPFKLRGFERFLQKYPRDRDRVMLYQVAVPSRTEVPAYQDLAREVDELVGRINGRYGTLNSSPVYYLNKNIPFEQLCALYAVSDFALVTPTRDGMNLVAKEFVVCNREKKGVLILSEFAGAAHSLSGSLLVNPWDTDGVADAIHAALEMDDSERERRFVPMYRYLMDNTAVKWARRFICDLSGMKVTRPAGTSAHTLASVKHQIMSAYKKARHRLFFIDYDGTLTPIRRFPSEAAPDKKLLSLLTRLSADKKNAVHLVSGRHRRDLEAWFGDLAIHLCCEHGYAYRRPGTRRWLSDEVAEPFWKEQVREVMEYFCARTPGTFIEEKPASLAWHYRAADSDFGQWQAEELLAHLEEALSHIPAETIKGRSVIEVRPYGVSKGHYVKKIIRKLTKKAEFIFCVGDDQTDEDMYPELPGTAWTCHVGGPRRGARFYAQDSREVRETLAMLVK